MSTWITRFDTGGAAATPKADVLRLAVKDLIDMVGVPTTNGSKVVAATAEPAVTDAACLAGTRAAEAGGALVIVGKTNLHELAFGVTGINPWYGTPQNPLDRRLVPGGSSSGSATAVGAGEADVAFGSDTGGSIRIPAACCGVVGLKTTRGRISLEGVRPLAPSLDTIGPMGATVGAVVAGMALLEPGFAPAPSAVARIGRVRLPAESVIDAALDRALAATGIEVVEVTLPLWDAATDAAMTVLAAEAWAVHASLWRDHGSGLSPDVAERLASASAITAAQVEGGWAQARAWATEVAVTFQRVDLLAMPTLAEAPPSLDNGGRLTQIRHVAPWNLAGLPALAMPVPTDRGGVPASLQLVGPAGREDLIVAMAAAVEEAAPFSR